MIAVFFPYPLTSSIERAIQLDNGFIGKPRTLCDKKWRNRIPPVLSAFIHPGLGIINDIRLAENMERSSLEQSYFCFDFIVFWLVSYSTTSEPCGIFYILSSIQNSPFRLDNNPYTWHISSYNHSNY
ncbi:hypothetical protein EMIT0P294_40180 [Pseudomonas sp. IT-P294]